MRDAGTTGNHPEMYLIETGNAMGIEGIQTYFLGRLPQSITKANTQYLSE